MPFQHKVYHFLSVLADILLPPRHSELLLRARSNESLALLARPDGTLPYHNQLIRALVWEVKYRKNAHALLLGGTFLYERLLQLAEDELGTMMLVPVPMHPKRKRARGYNQTELLCEAIMRRDPHSFIYAPHVLVRIRATVPQQGLPRHIRIKNVRGSMSVTGPEAVRGKTCVVIDDVSTTGATADEAKRALLAGGASCVHILTLARA